MRSNLAFLESLSKAGRSKGTIFVFVSGFSALLSMPPKPDQCGLGTVYSSDPLPKQPVPDQVLGSEYVDQQHLNCCL